MFQIELKEQYKIMQELKKRRTQSQAEKGTEEQLNQASNLGNKLKTTEDSLQENKTKLSDLKKECERLEKTVEVEEDEENRN